MFRTNISWEKQHRHPGSNIKKNNYTTVEDVIVGFPHPILPTVQGGEDYHTIHSIRKLFQENWRSIDSFLWGVFLGNINIVVYATFYSVVDPTTPWINPELSRRPHQQLIMELWRKFAQKDTYWRNQVQYSKHKTPWSRCSKRIS